MRVLSQILSLALLAVTPFAAAGGTFCVTDRVAVVNRGGTLPRVYLLNDTATSSFWVAASNLPDCRPGDVIAARGHSKPITNNENDFFAESVVRLRREPLPPAPDVTGSQVNGGECFGQTVGVQGVLASAVRDDVNEVWNLLTLRTPTGKVFAAVPESEIPLHRLTALRDAEVRLSGLVTRFGVWRSFLGYEILLFGTDGLAVEKPPADDPFAAPPFTFREALHRQRAEGTVLAVGRRKVFLRTDRQTLLPITPVTDSPRPHPGQRLSVVGFTEPDQRNLQLVEAEIRPHPGPDEPLAVGEDIDPETLYADADGRSFANTEYYGRFLRLTGTVVNSSENMRFSGALILACGKRTVSVDVSSLVNGLAPSLEPGCTVSVTGLCVAEFENAADTPLLPRFTGFSLIPRTAADLVILRCPPWWTPLKLLAVIALLVLLLAGILVWNHALAVRSEQRGQELAREQSQHAAADLKVEERTRLAVELHDAISQTLTGVAFQIETALGIGRDTLGPARKFLDTANQMLASCRQELYCCLWDLHSRTFEEKDLTEAIQRTIAPHAERANITVRFNVPREDLSESTVHAILKIVRELVVNALRHGRAENIRIAGEYHEGRVRFSVADDGCGFDEASAPGPVQGHFGLQGIRERAAEKSGAVEIASRPGRGTKVTVSLKEDIACPNANA